MLDSIPAALAVLFAATAGRAVAAGIAVEQQPLHDSSSLQQTDKGGRHKLHGRFLQVTDFHPDRFYNVYSSTAKGFACHRGSGPAGYYGAETSECDSPISLINATFDWLDKEVKNGIDFVIWTGDSARHDNDEEIPRSTEQVISLNEFMVQKFVDVFGAKQDRPDQTENFVVPIVPTLGNNDILPHNIFEIGPNRWTKTYLDVWRRFIPEEQRHQFEQGGWFSVEVIPNHLAVFSLNSLYFFDNNAAVDGCAAKSEPGYRQLEWMRIQLQFLRERGMKAIIIGHVPPARTEGKQAWDESCWQKYTLWMRQYRDVVTGSLYGHMNYDHFIMHDFHDIESDVEKGLDVAKVGSKGGELGTMSATGYLVELRKTFAKLPKKPKWLKKAKVAEEAVTEDEISIMEAMSDDARPDWEVDAMVKRGKGKKGGKKGDKKKEKKEKARKKYLKKIGGPFGERFSVSHVSPSVVPNYYPTIRIYEYNITGLDNLGKPHSDLSLLSQPPPDVEDQTVMKKSRKEKKRRFRVPEAPSVSAPPGPAYSPQTLSLLGFTQYFANLTRINNDFVIQTSAEGDEQSSEDVSFDPSWKGGKHKDKKPKDEDLEPHPKKFKFEVLYETRNDSVYNLRDLTVPSHLDLAQRIGRAKDKAASEEAHDNDVEAEDRDDELSSEKKKKHKGKKGKKHHKNISKAWYTFVQRAFVGTMEQDEIEELFGP